MIFQPSRTPLNINHNHTHLAYVLLRLAADVAVRDPQKADASSDHRVSTPFSATSQSDWVEGVKLWNEYGKQLIRELPRRNCPACGQDKSRSLFESYDGYPFVECILCGCWYVPLKVEEELFQRFFSETPKAFEVLLRTLESRSTEASHRFSLERIGTYLDKLIPLLSGSGPLSYLDMGCGFGQSLQAAQARGLEAIGIESSRECISFAIKAGLKVFHVSEQDLQQKFDLVSFWESLEHMTDPAAVLQDCLKHLAPKGLLAFSVPNQNSPLVRLQRGDCSSINGGYATAGHINLFNPQTVDRLLDRSGYTLLALDGQYSLDMGELLSYLLGNQRSAYDLLQGRVVQNDLSEESNSLLRTIGPACALLERLTLTAPILFGFACRKDDIDYFAPALVKYRNDRRDQLLAQIQEMEVVPSNIGVLQQKLADAENHITDLEEQLRVIRDSPSLLARFVRRVRNRFDS